MILNEQPEQVPGVWECPHCGYVLHKNTLNVQNAIITPDRSPFNEVCPNDGKLMQPLTYKKAFTDLSTVCEQQISRAYQAEQMLEIAINARPCTCIEPNSAEHDAQCERRLFAEQIFRVFEARERARAKQPSQNS